ncbi:hypothetical protein [Sporolactobacillus sp. THM19-2]|uniref:hypothetical protein n=1 Tax=Sporolactobacillus sp. THM19-2 TaxID=2511171 RepID=UPI0010228A79|nr:hypothetical protein [Sporolactobacillus sp. THM19-2]RYL93277.1 hypothetical protein EWH91_05385 [Sporolactobacillus sp. THM19-2]
MIWKADTDLLTFEEKAMDDMDRAMRIRWCTFSASWIKRSTGRSARKAGKRTGKRHSPLSRLRRGNSVLCMQKTIRIASLLKQVSS